MSFLVFAFHTISFHILISSTFPVIRLKVISLLSLPCLSFLASFYLLLLPSWHSPSFPITLYVLTLYLFICSAFNEAVSAPEYAPSDNNIKWKACRIKRTYPIPECSWTDYGKSWKVLTRVVGEVGKE
jgi:hypothetical protein